MVQADSDIPVRNKRMKCKRRIRTGIVGGCILLASVLASCGTSRKSAALQDGKRHFTERKVLSYEQQRKFDYFFHEAVRLKEIGELDAAFEMYSHCLDIYPQSAVTLYELGEEKAEPKDCPFRKGFDSLKKKALSLIVSMLPSTDISVK